MLPETRRCCDAASSLGVDSSGRGVVFEVGARDLEIRARGAAGAELAEAGAGLASTGADDGTELAETKTDDGAGFVSTDADDGAGAGVAEPVSATEDDAGEAEPAGGGGGGTSAPVDPDPANAVNAL